MCREHLGISNNTEQKLWQQKTKHFHVRFVFRLDGPPQRRLCLSRNCIWFYWQQDTGKCIQRFTKMQNNFFVKYAKKIFEVTTHAFLLTDRQALENHIRWWVLNVNQVQIKASKKVSLDKIVWNKPNMHFYKMLFQGIIPRLCSKLFELIDSNEEDHKARLAQIKLAVKTLKL